MAINETNNEHLSALAHYDRFYSNCMHVKAFLTFLCPHFDTSAKCNIMLLTTNEVFNENFSTVLFMDNGTLFFF